MYKKGDRRDLNAPGKSREDSKQDMKLTPQHMRFTDNTR